MLPNRDKVELYKYPEHRIVDCLQRKIFRDSLFGGVTLFIQTLLYQHYNDKAIAPYI